MKQTTLKELAALIDGLVVGDDTIQICGISTIEDARAGDVTYAETARLLELAARSHASAVIAPQSSADISKPLIRVKNPKFAFAQVLRVFAPETKVYQGIHASAHIASTTEMGQNVSVHANAVIGDSSRLGNNTVIYPFVYIGDNVTIW